jgi:hypothetical protein
MNRSIPHFTALVKPADKYAYFDKIQLWVRHPIDRIKISQLWHQCGYVHVENSPAPFGGKYGQRIEIKQPGEEALVWLASRRDGFINQIENSLDFIFSVAEERERTEGILHRHLIRRWHGKNQEIRVVGETEKGVTRYDGPRSAPNITVVYGSKPCRITGEVYCVHVDWRAKGRRAVQSIGIETEQDLLQFDHREFWRKKLMLVDIDEERLGRYIRNCSTGSRSRNNGRSANLDRRLGHDTLSRYDSLQELLDEYRGWGIQRILTIVPNQDLLPEPNSAGEARSR